MQKQNLIECIETYAPLSSQANWDFSGVQIESFKQEFSHLALMLDPTWENIEKALEKKADAILSHHPLSMGGYRLNEINGLYKAVHLAITNNLFVYAAHTSLDANFLGFASWLATDLALNALSPLDEEENFGSIGHLEKSTSITNIVEILEKSMPFISKRDFRLIGKNQEREIKTIAFCFGSGSSLYEIAKKKGADLFITGDVKYHQALDITCAFEGKEDPLMLDVGHFSLEEEMMRRFALHLQKNADIEISFIEGTNPFCSLIEI